MAGKTTTFALPGFLKTRPTFAYLPRATKRNNKLIPRFTDYKVISIRGGHGGDGCISFGRIPRQPYGPPDGGNGGRGGNVYIVADPDATSLGNLSRHYAGGDGKPGQGMGKNGAAGKDIDIVVPVGTLVREIRPPEHDINRTSTEHDSLIDLFKSNLFGFLQKFYKFGHHYEPQDDRKLNLLSILQPFPPYESNSFAKTSRLHRRRRGSRSSKNSDTQDKPPRELINIDLSSPGRYLLAQGGQGGSGNPSFASGGGAAPKICSRGLPGVSRWFELELKLLADVGLVGLPNAGKSTFLSGITNAKAKAGSYAFTTMRPYVGTLDLISGKTVTVADLPGLIAGASDNKGLGHDFLRHIERSKVLVYIISLVEKPTETLKTLRRELEQYNPDLVTRPSVVVANKADLPGTEQEYKQLKEYVDSLGDQVKMVPISALERKNLHQCVDLIVSVVEEARKSERSLVESEDNENR